MCERSSKVFWPSVKPTREDHYHDDMWRSVKSAHAMYREWLEREKEEEKKRREKVKEGNRSLNMLKKKGKGLLKERIISKEWRESEWARRKGKTGVKCSRWAFKDARLKLDSALASKPISTNSMATAKVMLETAEKKRREAMEKLDEIGKKQKSLDKSTHKLLDQALSSKALP